MRHHEDRDPETHAAYEAALDAIPDEMRAMACPQCDAAAGCLRESFQGRRRILWICDVCHYVIAEDDAIEAALEARAP